jgi:Cdc6-like AAA superfamily ATPase
MKARTPALSQRRFLVQQYFEMLPDDYLLFRAKTPSQHNEVRLDLFDVAMHPTTLMHSSRYLLWGSGVWWLLAFTCTLLGVLRGFDSYLEPIVIWSVLAVVCSVAYLLSRKTMLVYGHKRTGATLLVIYLLKHNQSEREQFVEQLNKTLEHLSLYPNRDVYKQQSRLDPPKFKRDSSMLN